MTVATKTAVEVLRFAPESERTRLIFDALINSRRARELGIEATLNAGTYRGDSPWLVLWGPGAPPRMDVMRRHVAAGGRVLAFDLAYWDRARKLRVSIDAPHPQDWVMRKPLPTGRLQGDVMFSPVSDRWNPNGPIIIAGLGQKARVQYGATNVDAWEADMMRACRERWARPVVYRRKKADAAMPLWVTAEAKGEIEDALAGASLVITWHSNVAVDAIRMGIPVICRDGAAAAVSPSMLCDVHVPLSADVRDRFLANLAWFQWAPDEADAFWLFASELLS